MTKMAVIKTGGKQYLIKEGDQIVVDQLNGKEKNKVDLETLAIFESDKNIELGTPALKQKVTAEIINQLKGDKIRIGRFKAKVRYRKVRGFRPRLSKIKILKI